MMERLADAGDGAYVYVDGLEEAQRVLGTDLGATLETVARDLKIQLEFDPAAVRGWRQVGYVNRQIADRDFRNDAVDAGEVGSGHQVTALYELELAPDWQLRGAVGTVRLRAKPPGPDRAADEWTAALTGSLAGAPSPDSRLAITAMHRADGLRTRRRAPVQAALAEAQALKAQGREGAQELAGLCAQALALLPPTGLAQAGTGR
jgi:Ca-activated chloride channel family protein